MKNNLSRLDLSTVTIVPSFWVPNPYPRASSKSLESLAFFGGEGVTAVGSCFCGCAWWGLLVGVVILADAHLFSTLTLHVYCLL